MSPLSALRRTCLVTAAAVILAGSGAAIAAPSRAATGGPAGLPSVVPSWAATAQVLGATPLTQTVDVGLALRGRDDAGLARFAAAVSTPGNPGYHHFLTNAQFTDSFAAPASAGATVISWLRAAGVTDVSIDGDHTLVRAAMPAALAAVIFGTTFEQVMHNRVSTRVPLTEPVLPAVIAPLVSAVAGLTQSSVHRDDVPPPPPASYSARPCSTVYGDTVASGQPAYQLPTDAGPTSKPDVNCGYTPAQVRGAYGVASTPYTGAGVTVGIVDAYDATLVAGDTDTYSQVHGLSPVSFADVSPPGLSDSSADANGQADQQGWAEEETLDWEAVHAMAPGAKIVYSGARSTGLVDFFSAVLAALQNGAQEVSNSYGLPGDPEPGMEAAFKQTVTDYAASIGAGLEFSSGDTADEVVNTGYRQVDFPATSDGVTAVGGTALEVGSGNSYGGETYWGNYEAGENAGGTAWRTPYFSAGGGGGVSTVYPEPAWQQAVVPASLTQNTDAGTSVPGRVVPDVAMLADSDTGFLVGETEVPDAGPNSGKPTYVEAALGGTSVASPLFAGVMALVVQADGPQGDINPTIYTFGSSAFNDPSLGRAPGASRSGGTADQSQLNPYGYSFEGAGPGVVPTIAEVNAYAQDPSNPGSATEAYDLETGGNLGTLHDFPGYDDSTGLGSPNVPNLIQAFQSATAAARAAAAAAAAPAPAAAPAAPVVAVQPMAPCVVHASAIKVTGPNYVKKSSQTKKFTFKLFVGSGSCAVGTSVGRKFNVYVDGHLVGTLRTGQHGTISHLYKVKGGRHVITARFPGNPDLAKSTSNSQVVHAS